MSYNDTLRTRPQGHLRVWDKTSGEVLLDTHNDINAENMSYAIASSLVGLKDGGGNSYGNIRYMVFGNGGARVTSSNKFIYSVPQTVGRAASLYNETFRKDILASDDKENTYMNVTHAVGNEYSDIVVRCTLKKDEALGVLGSAEENGSIITEQTFSEIGLVTGGGDLITHLCFFPLLKSQNSELIFDYILRIQIV